MEIKHGYWRWKIYRWDRHPNPFRGRSDLALNWLRRFETDRRVMSELRQLLADARSGAMARSTDRQLLEDVAQRIGAGEFLVCAESSHPFYQDTTEVKIAAPVTSEELEAVAPAPAPAPAPTPAAAAAAAAAAAPAEATLPGNADADRIADSLKDAAKTGTPFCEECQKAPASTPSFSLPMPVASGGGASAQTSAEAQGVMRSATATDAPTNDGAVPPSEGGLPPNVDPAGLARSLKQASADGSPFCPETERAGLPAAAP